MSHKRITDAEYPKHFYSKVNKRGSFPHAVACRLYPEIAGTRCWNWPLTREGQRYGQVGFRGKVCQSHRVSFQLATGKELDNSDYICHKCDNPSCVRPSHLFLADQLDNMRDMVSKKRSIHRYGEANPCNKLSIEDIEKIKKLLKREWTQPRIASRFGISRRVVSAINTGKHWSSV